MVQNYSSRFRSPLFALGSWTKWSEAVNCAALASKRGRPYTYYWFKIIAPDFGLHYFALGNKSGGFCEAVNCERSEQEGKFLFAYLMVPICWYPPPSKTSWHNARESAESSGTIYLDTLVTIRKSVYVIFVHMFDDPFVIAKFEYFFTVFVYYFTVLSRDLIFIDDSYFPNLSFNYFAQTIVI